MDKAQSARSAPLHNRAFCCDGDDRGRGKNLVGVSAVHMPQGLEPRVRRLTPIETSTVVRTVELLRKAARSRPCYPIETLSSPDRGIWRDNS